VYIPSSKTYLPKIQFIQKNVTNNIDIKKTLINCIATEGDTHIKGAAGWFQSRRFFAW